MVKSIKDYKCTISNINTQGNNYQLGCIDAHIIVMVPKEIIKSHEDILQGKYVRSLDNFKGQKIVIKKTDIIKIEEGMSAPFIYVSNLEIMNPSQKKTKKNE